MHTFIRFAIQNQTDTNEGCYLQINILLCFICNLHTVWYEIFGECRRLAVFKVRTLKNL